MCFYGSEGLGLRADNLKVHCIVAAWYWPSYLSPELYEQGIKVKLSSIQDKEGIKFRDQKLTETTLILLLLLMKLLKQALMKH